jgi:hypothetical protein
MPYMCRATSDRGVRRCVRMRWVDCGGGGVGVSFRYGSGPVVFIVGVLAVLAIECGHKAVRTPCVLLRNLTFCAFDKGENLGYCHIHAQLD